MNLVLYAPLSSFLSLFFCRLVTYNRRPISLQHVISVRGHTYRRTVLFPIIRRPFNTLQYHADTISDVGGPLLRVSVISNEMDLFLVGLVLIEFDLPEPNLGCMLIVWPAYWTWMGYGLASQRGPYRGPGMRAQMIIKHKRELKCHSLFFFRRHDESYQEGGNAR